MSSGLSHAIHLISSHADIQEKCQRQLDEIFGTVVLSHCRREELSPPVSVSVSMSDCCRQAASDHMERSIQDDLPGNVYQGVDETVSVCAVDWPNPQPGYGIQ